MVWEPFLCTKSDGRNTSEGILNLCVALKMGKIPPSWVTGWLISDYFARCNAAFVPYRVLSTVQVWTINTIQNENYSFERLQLYYTLCSMSDEGLNHRCSPVLVSESCNGSDRITAFEPPMVSHVAQVWKGKNEANIVLSVFHLQVKHMQVKQRINTKRSGNINVPRKVQ